MLGSSHLNSNNQNLIKLNDAGSYLSNKFKCAAYEYIWFENDNHRNNDGKLMCRWNLSRNNSKNSIHFQCRNSLDIFEHFSWCLLIHPMCDENELTTFMINREQCQIFIDERRECVKMRNRSESTHLQSD